ncbi:MAG: hypothetical protein LBF95_09925 [Treponema sp.]|jgi:hypothetical protein|nr:hypothetical protein [Treponema sp.]
MTAEEAVERGKSLNFEKIWAIFAEIGQRQVKTDGQIAEIGQKQAESAEQIKEIGQRQVKTDEQLTRLEKTVARVSENVGGLNGSMGELIETLFAPHLGEKFDGYGYNLKRIFHRVNIYDETSRQRGEIDILLSNTTVCMAVEVKRWLDKTEKVDDHIRRMQLIREYPPAETKGKKLLGAIVGGVVNPEVQRYAERNGFFVLELTGEDVRLLEPPDDFKPKEW